jgi:hypothetical protein
MRAFWISVARAESMPCWPCSFLWRDDFALAWVFPVDLVVWPECAWVVEVFLWAVVVVAVVANAGAARTAADSRNARLARDKSMLVTSRVKFLDVRSEFYLNAHRVCQQKGIGTRRMRIVTITKVQ